MERLETGIDTLDKQLNGGVPPGAIVTCTTDSRTQSELLLHRVLSGHETLYITTIADADAVRAEFMKSPVDTGDVEIAYTAPDGALQHVKDRIEACDSARLIIVDSITRFEDASVTSRGSYQAFVNWL